ncbi:hypothetical protein Mmc1_3067 [Magnetococcus marinus MC-1]|uniref:Uncharacterized protein n=1 Tax=Magnetococcus marinus (strain ATCC BAA-1437 / JCM 17883 / MC-1) TaxID=156889 RepID=A0LC65_MAGMM|nr:hypothetical protein Mmc1_3067 [Magnetococcus marinus MC-1]
MRNAPPFLGILAIKKLPHPTQRPVCLPIPFWFNPAAQEQGRQFYKCVALRPSPKPLYHQKAFKQQGLAPHPFKQGVTQFPAHLQNLIKEHDKTSNMHHNFYNTSNPLTQSMGVDRLQTPLLRLNFAH